MIICYKLSYKLQMTTELIRGYDCLNVSITFCEKHKQNVLKDEQIYFIFGGRKVYIEDGELITDSHTLIETQLNRIYVQKRDISYWHTIDRVDKYLEECFNANNILILCLNSGLLTYRNIFVSNLGSEHYVCVTKYSSSKKQVFVYDGYIQNEKSDCFNGWIDVDEISRAWQATNYLHYIWDKSYLRGEDIKRSILSSVKETIQSYIFSISSDGRVCGERAIYIWLEGLSCDDNIDNIMHQIKIRGLITIKNYLLKYFEGNVKEKSLVEQYHDIIVQWEKCCMLLYYMKLRKKKELFDEFKQQIVKLIPIEHRILEELLTYL